MAKIVFCEDDPMVRKLVQTAMRATPHEVHFAVNGHEGLALVEGLRPDLLVTDVSMPEMDGFQLADAVRAHPSLSALPILFMTASVQRDQIEECFKHGATAYLAKPFSTADLRKQVSELVSA